MLRHAACALLIIGCGGAPAMAPRDGAGFPDGAPADAGAPPDADVDVKVDADAEPAWPPARVATTLPLEVLGAPGIGVEASIVLAAIDVERARTSGATLTLTVQNIVAPDSATVSVNDGAPLDLGDPDGPWLRRHDGRVSSGAVAIDPGLLRAGANRIVFRYTRQLVVDLAAVSGFRVLGGAISVGGATLHPIGLPAEDPGAWAPHDPSPEAIARGRIYFQEVSRDEGPACARCHPDSGADLQYYAFSTHSIVERAMFHRFNRAEAEDLASYIRSVPVAPVGRPYDPPFQPGHGNHGAAGAGHSAVLNDDAAFSQSAFGGAALPASPAWPWAAAVDTFQQPSAVAAPTWLRWLPRHLEPDWFERDGGLLASAEKALAQQGTLQAAQAFMSAALVIGKQLVAEGGDYVGKIEVLRFAAVKLWDWSRKNGFHNPDHGMPDGSPAYPYEVGFGFFEASQSTALPGAALQTMQWWWAQLAANPGRGLSTGKRPLNFLDTLSAAENAGLGAGHVAFLHLYGSWEESRGALADRWGTAEGPVRLLAISMRPLSAADRAAVMRRFLMQESAFLEQGGALDAGHHAKLADAWSRSCGVLSAPQRSELRALASPAVQPDLIACP
jgi:hypothetical protein